jgi:acyl carrier protein
MNADEIRGRLTRVFEQVFGYQGALRDDLKAGDLEGWDSATHVSLVLAAERAFKIKFKGADIANMASVGEIVKQVAAKVS